MEKTLMKNVTEAASLVALSAGIGFTGRKVFKKNLTSDPSASLMNYAQWVAVMTGSIYALDYLIAQKFIPKE